MFRLLSLLAFGLAAVSAAPEADRITSLPGWEGDLPTPQYSGYLSMEGGTNLHYWFVSAEIPDVPTVLWLNGGPGCSSLDGFIYEHGPFEVTADNTLVEREYRWNKQANMLYIEAPVGVGFSYSDTGNYKCDDDRTANENMLAVERFFELFPELNNDKGFYITGESYAGVYVPTLAEAILQATDAGTYTGAPLKGIAVGNGCSGTEVGICGSGPQGTFYEWSYLTQTAFVSNAMKAKVNEQCDWTAAAKNIEGAISPLCAALLDEISTGLANINVYNIYGECINDSGCTAKDALSGTYGESIITHGKIPSITRKGSPRLLGSPHGPKYCIDSRYASSYLNQAEVQAAIHVNNRPSADCWSVCGTAPGWSYNSTRPNLPRDTYPYLVSNIRVTIYNGDWDACVPYTDGEGWTTGMGLPVSNAWHQWTYTAQDGGAGQVAGYATEYDVSSMGEGSFEFITVKGGRHEVPETAPEQAMEMLKRVLNSETF